MSSRKVTRSSPVRRVRRTSPQADVIVIGGGVIGCACAFELNRNGVRVTVLERSIIGAEASTAAAGILGAHVEAEHPGPMSELLRKSLRLYPRLAENLEQSTGIDIELRRCGSLRIESEKTVLSRAYRALSWQGPRNVERLTAPAVRKLEPSLQGSLAGGLRFPFDARVDPPRLLEALHIAAARAGVRFVTGAQVRNVAFENKQLVGVALENGELLRGGTVVVAAGSWTTRVAGLTLRARAVQPARGQIVLLKTAVPILRHVVFGPDCYLVPRDDGRVLVGSTLEFAGYEKRVTAAGARNLLVAATRLVPELDAAELAGTWSNFRPYTDDELPIIGPGEHPGLVYATGHYRNGILLAPITAEIVSCVIRGKKPPLALEPFSPARFSA